MPVRISFAASVTASEVRRFKVPNWSSGPYKPHAEHGGSLGRKGKESKVGRGIVLQPLIKRVKEISRKIWSRDISNCLVVEVCGSEV